MKDEEGEQRSEVRDQKADCRRQIDDSSIENRKSKIENPSSRGPYKFDETARLRFCTGLEFGLTREESAAHVGVSDRTVRRAVQSDAEFAEQVRRAELMCDVQPKLIIRKAAQSSWRAAAWSINYRRRRSSVPPRQASPPGAAGAADAPRGHAAGPGDLHSDADRAVLDEMMKKEFS